MSISLIIQSQLLATKFFVPSSSRTLISRPHLTALLSESLKYSLTLVSAPAGFGKTMLLSAWVQSLPANDPLIAWVSLDEEDNDPRLFWTYVLSALDQQQPERFTPLLKYLQSEPAPPLMSVLTVLINLVLDSQEHFMLILDDYHVITEQRVHTTLSYLVEHLPSQLHIILATRADPPLPLSLLWARQQVLEVRTEQLRCTIKETRDFFHEVMSIELPNKVIQQVTARTEGWLVGLQLLGLSLQGHTDPAILLEELSGDQRYILDYLTDEVLQRQPQDVQTFLLSTCILERLNASLCNVVIGLDNSQQMLEWLEQANLFVVSLDSNRQWYRYHALFAEALRYRLEGALGDQVPTLHHRASIWYAEHQQTTQAILHAFNARQWQWAADMIEQTPSLLSLTWGADEHELVLLRQWLKQLPVDVMCSLPRLYLACAELLWQFVPYPMAEAWLNAAEAAVTHTDTSDMVHDQQVLLEQENLLGEIFSIRAMMWSFKKDGRAALSLCQQALALVSADSYLVRLQVAIAQIIASYASSENDAIAAIQYGLEGISLAQSTGQPTLTICLMDTTAYYMIGAGWLHEALQLSQQAILLGTKPGGLVLPDVGCPMLWKAEILREWNQLDAALPLSEEAISLCKQTESIISTIYILYGYVVLMRVHLSRGDYDAACSAFQQVEHIGISMNQPWYSYLRSLFTTIDQVRLWLACGDLDSATRWAEESELGWPPDSPLVYEREEVARIRILLAKDQPTIALQRLKPVLERATTGQRWGHVIEIQLLKALAYQMHEEETKALSSLSEAIRLAEPQGYIRSFVDEGSPMAALLCRLREQQCRDGPTCYLDTLLAAFPKQNKAHKQLPKMARKHTKGNSKLFLHKGCDTMVE